MKHDRFRFLPARQQRQHQAPAGGAASHACAPEPEFDAAMTDTASAVLRAIGEQGVRLGGDREALRERVARLRRHRSQLLASLEEELMVNELIERLQQAALLQDMAERYPDLVAQVIGSHCAPAQGVTRGGATQQQRQDQDEKQEGEG